jgi:hypothetical protein
MPKVITERCVLDGAEEKQLDFRYDIYVSAEGLFSTTLPKHIVALFQDANVGLKKNRIGNEGYLSANTMPELKAKVIALGKEYLSRDLVSEKIIIRYSIQTTCSYVLDAEGNIHPNGYGVPGFNTTAFFKEGTLTQHATERHPFGILIYAQPFWRREYAYRSGNHKTEYERLSDSRSLMEGKPALTWLNRVTSIAPPRGELLKEIDYTEPVAAFFVSLLVSMCKLNERIKDFLDPESIQQLVDGNVKLLP